MSTSVKPEDRRTARARETEERIVRAAHELFLERGYAGTSLADIADAADVAARTVYVRFGTKAALIKRVVDIALVGDAAPIPLIEREWFQQGLTAPTLEERIRANARGSAELMARAAGVIAVANEAAGEEPMLAEARQAGRDATRASMRTFWRRAAADGLLPESSDTNWLIETAALLVHAETYLLMRATAGWAPKRYEKWLTDTLQRLAAASAR